MGNFLYFIPGVGSESDYRAKAAEFGIDYIYPAGRPPVRIQKGPQGSGGLTANPATTKHIGYYPDEQDWHSILGGKLWIATQKTGLPGPQDLERPNLIDGHSVMLEDGSQWLIPVARWIRGQGEVEYGLPQIVSRNLETGDWETRIKSEYNDFFNRAIQVWEMFTEDDSHDDWAPEDDLKLVEDALSLNYFIGSWEITILELFGNQSVGEMLRSIIDFPGLKKLLDAKKKENITKDVSDGSSSTLGDVEAVQDIALPSLT